jgi:hypothetical protein
MEPDWSAKHLLVGQEAMASHQIRSPAQTAFRAEIGH